VLVAQSVLINKNAATITAQTQTAAFWLTMKHAQKEQNALAVLAQEKLKSALKRQVSHAKEVKNVLLAGVQINRLRQRKNA